MDTETRIKISAYQRNVSDECSPSEKTTFEVLKFPGYDNIAFIFGDTEISVDKSEIEKILQFSIDDNSVEQLRDEVNKIKSFLVL